jgi:hypothetical protein
MILCCSQAIEFFCAIVRGRQATTNFITPAKLNSEAHPMQKAIFHNRRAIQIENDSIRVTTTEEGGHIAEILNKTTGVNPLWIPPWLSIEASAWSPVDTPEYGEDADAQLLAAIMGHNLCLDLFGPPEL